MRFRGNTGAGIRDKKEIMYGCIYTYGMYKILKKTFK